MPVNLATWTDELEQLARALGRTGPDEVCCEGMTPRQCGILRTLVEKQGARISDLAEESGITPSAMTRVLEKLEKQQLVQRVRGQGKDGRAAMVAITARGRETRRSIDRLMQERTRAIVGAIPEGFRERVLACLRMLNAALAPNGCCQVTQDESGAAVSCGLTSGPAKARKQRSHHGK
jgi:MarR family transcriptional regulator, transcriptional regulator for hemolysin